MQPRLQATLADFVPALRFVAPELVAEYLEHSDLPDAWWMSVPVVRATETFGRQALPERLSDLAYTELRHLRLGDLLPGAWLASNGFRLSQWPDGARTNVMVRTPDWADLLTTTVREVGDWTQIGTSTVRPLVARLFEEVLGLLPADDESVDIDAVAAPTPAAAGAQAFADNVVDAAVSASSGTVAEPDAEPVVEDGPEALETNAPESGTVDDEWGDLDEDSLHPVRAPEPLTAELGTVVRWLAEQAPDVPLMTQLARITLETAAVVGLEEATPQVREALAALLTQVPSGLRASLAMPQAPVQEMPVDAFGQTPQPPQDAVVAGLDAWGEVPPTTSAGLPAVVPRDPTPPGGVAAVDVPIVDENKHARPRRDAPAAGPPREAPTEADHPGVDAYGETPPRTMADVPLPPVKTKKGGRRSAEDAAPVPPVATDPGRDAYGEVPPPTAGDVPIVTGPETPRTPAGLPIPPRPTRPPQAPAASESAPSVPAPPAHSAVPHTNRGTRAADPEATVEMVPGMTPPPGGDVTMLVDRPTPRANVPGGGDLEEVLSSWFADAEPRRKVIARDRLFTDTPRELDSLAAEFDTSPAEVKIMERDLRRNLDERIGRSEGAPVRVHLSFVRDRLGVLTTVSELRNLHKRHTAIVRGLDIQVWQVLRGLLGLHTSVDGWLSAAPLGELADRTAATLDTACAHGPVPLKALERDLAAMGVRAPLQSAWIARLEGFQIENGHVLSRSADTLERPAARSAPIGDPSWAAGCFREDSGSWAFRVDVTTAMLEGEPVKVPPSFAQSLGVTPGGQVRLHHGHGPAAMRWAETPYLVSLRAILAGLAAHEGDMVFISSIHPGRLEARLVRGDASVRLPRWARALRHTGVDPVPEQVNLPELLGARVGLEPGVDLKAVLHRLQQRGDADVLELLGVTPQSPH